MKKLLFVSFILLSGIIYGQKSDTVTYHCKVLKQTIKGDTNKTGTIVSITTFSTEEKPGKIYSLKVTQYFVVNGDDQDEEESVNFENIEVSLSAGKETFFLCHYTDKVTDALPSINSLDYGIEAYYYIPPYNDSMKMLQIDEQRKHYFIPNSYSISLNQKQRYGLVTSEEKLINFVF